MKILIYDIELFSSGVRYPLKEACEDLEHSADMFDWTYYFNGPNNPTLTNRIKDRLLKKFYIDKLNADLQRIIKLGNYDLFLVMQGKNIYPETIKIAVDNIKYVVNWNSDDPMNMLNSTQWLIDALPLYHAHFTPRIHLKQEYENYGVKQLFELDWYYRYGINPVQSHNENYEYEGNFIGSWSQRRAEFVNAVDSDKIDVFGWGWQNKHKGSRVHNSVNIIKMIDIFSKTKINLNLLTIENRDVTNLRNFEVAAAHGFKLAEKSDRLLKIFEEDKDIVFFSTVEEMKDKFNYYLTHDKERIPIAEKSYETIVVKGKNTLVDRIEQILKTLDKL